MHTIRSWTALLLTAVLGSGAYVASTEVEFAGIAPYT